MIGGAQCMPLKGGVNWPDSGPRGGRRGPRAFFYRAKMKKGERSRSPFALRLCGHGLGLDGLQSVEIIGGALRVGGGLEDGALIVL